MSFLRQYLLAVRFFTRVPVTGPLAQWVAGGPEVVRGSAAHFPGVGWLVGIVACCAFAVTGLALPEGPFSHLAAAVASVIASSMLTGAVHESSLARFADLLARPRGEAPGASHGTDAGPAPAGVLTLVLVVLAKLSLLAVLASQSAAAVIGVLLAGHVVSRFWPLLLAHTLPGQVDIAGGQPWAEPLESRALAVAAAWSLVALAIAWLAADAACVIVAVCASALAWLWMRNLLARRLYGFTDDALGGSQQVAETAFYLGAAIGLGLQ